MRYDLVGLAGAASLVSLAHGVVVVPGGDAKPYKGPAGVADEEAFFRQSAGDEFAGNQAVVLMSTFSEMQSGEVPVEIVPSSGSFIRGAIQAWGEHLHLIIRPEEIWFTILVQMNFFMNAHAEELRSMFVDFDGQQTMYLEDTEWFRVIQDFKNEIQRRVKVDWLLDWIMPRFTTTLPNDGMVATILMMGLAKAYFRYEGGIICGLPSVTLAGERRDWEGLLAKLDRLPAFGAEPAAYAARLRPILSRFVTSFDDPDSAATRKFWNQIVTATPEFICGGPKYYIGGWLTGFFYWDMDGKPYARNGDGVKLDNATYATLDIRRLPMGYARAPFLMHDFNGTARYEAYVMAGTLGKQITRGAPDGYAAAWARLNPAARLRYNASEHATLQPLSAWMLYGPRSHNDSGQRLAGDREVNTLLDQVGTYFNATRCGSTRRQPEGFNVE